MASRPGRSKGGGGGCQFKPPNDPYFRSQQCPNTDFDNNDPYDEYSPEDPLALSTTLSTLSTTQATYDKQTTVIHNYSITTLAETGELRFFAAKRAGSSGQLSTTWSINNLLLLFFIIIINNSISILINIITSTTIFTSLVFYSSLLTFFFVFIHLHYQFLLGCFLAATQQFLFSSSFFLQFTSLIQRSQIKAAAAIRLLQTLSSQSYHHQKHKNVFSSKWSNGKNNVLLLPLLSMLLLCGLPNATVGQHAKQVNIDDF